MAPQLVSARGLAALTFLLVAYLLAFYSVEMLDTLEAGLEVRSPKALVATQPNSTTTSAGTYTTELLSLNPLIIYINNFLSQDEVEDLLALRYVSERDRIRTNPGIAIL
jgi:hypothetical protein